MKTVATYPEGSEGANDGLSAAAYNIMHVLLAQCDNVLSALFTLPLSGGMNQIREEKQDFRPIAFD